MSALPSDLAVTVTAPARPEHLHVLRAVVGSTAVRHDLSLDAIEDLRIAVDEACSQLVRAGGTTITVRIASVPTGLEVRCSSDASVDPWPPADVARSLAARVLEGLADEVAWERDADGSPAIRIVQHGVEPAGS